MNDQTSQPAPADTAAEQSKGGERILRLVYTSEAVRDMSEDDLRALLDWARQNNGQRGIGGLLLYKDRRFIQVMEGPPKEVAALMKSIKQDSRHQKIRIMFEDSQGDRLFKEWGMAFVPMDAETEGRILGGGSFASAGGEGQDPGTTMVANLFKTMVKELETEAGRAWNP
jgi:hypothetical protein